MSQRAKKNREFEEVISQIQEALLQGGLREGEKLPGERKLEEMLAVHRGTVRGLAPHGNNFSKRLDSSCL